MYNFEILYTKLRIQIINGVEPPCTGGCKRQIDSQQTMAIRIASPRSEYDPCQRPSHWLCPAVDPETDRTCHSRLFPAYTIPIARERLTNLLVKHDVADAFVHRGRRGRFHRSSPTGLRRTCLLRSRTKTLFVPDCVSHHPLRITEA